MLYWYRLKCASWTTYLQAASSLPFPHHTQLPLRITGVLPQSRQQEVTLAASQEEGTRQAQEVARRGRRAGSGRLEAKLLLARRAGLVSQQAEQFLDLRHRQHRFDVVGEHTGVHLPEYGVPEYERRNSKRSERLTSVREYKIQKFFVSQP